MSILDEFSTKEKISNETPLSINRHLPLMKGRNYFSNIKNRFCVKIMPMATKQTLQRKAKKHARVHGFLKRMMDHDGRNVLKRRRTKGRKKITA